LGSGLRQVYASLSHSWNASSLEDHPTGCLTCLLQEERKYKGFIEVKSVWNSMFDSCGRQWFSGRSGFMLTGWRQYHHDKSRQTSVQEAQ
jgi:hypothetical protein